MKKQVKKQSIFPLLVFSIVFFGLPFWAQAAEINPESVLRLVNEARLKQGIEALTQNAKLMAAAKDKLNDMIENKYFAHTSPKGLTPWYWFGKNGYDYQYAGENLAISFLKAEDQQKAWMKSPTHRKNILNSNYLETGIAVGAGKIEGETSIITVQEFGTLSGAVAPKSGGKSQQILKDSELIKEEGKIIPQVLSIKESGEKQKPEVPQINSKQPEETGNFLEAAYSLGAFFLIISLALSPIAFLSMAFEKIIIAKMMHVENKNLAGV